MPSVRIGATRPTSSGETAPPLDTLAGPLAANASQNNTAFLPLHGERDREREFGVTIPVAGWTIHMDYFVNQAKNFFDHNAIGNANIYLPLTDAGALIRARELTVPSPMLWTACSCTLPTRTRRRTHSEASLAG